jgi:hypothetical protein
MTFYSDSTPPLFSTSQSPRTRESASEEREGEKKKKNYSPAKIEGCVFFCFFLFLGALLAFLGSIGRTKKTREMVCEGSKNVNKDMKDREKTRS